MILGVNGTPVPFLVNRALIQEQRNSGSVSAEQSADKEQRNSGSVSAEQSAGKEQRNSGSVSAEQSADKEQRNSGSVSCEQGANARSTELQFRSKKQHYVNFRFNMEYRDSNQPWDFQHI